MLLAVAKRRLQGRSAPLAASAATLGAPRGTRVPRASCAAWRGMIRLSHGAALFLRPDRWPLDVLTESTASATLRSTAPLRFVHASDSKYSSRYEENRTQ